MVFLLHGAFGVFRRLRMWDATRITLPGFSAFWSQMCFLTTGGPRWLILKSVRILPVHARLKKVRSIAAGFAATLAILQTLPAVVDI
jgi:hypothetical protein